MQLATCPWKPLELDEPVGVAMTNNSRKSYWYLCRPVYYGLVVHLPKCKP